MVIVQSKELGTNCWSAARFCGGRCPKVMTCKYPEKATCKAVTSEIEYLNNRYAVESAQLTKRHETAIQILEKGEV